MASSPSDDSDSTLESPYMSDSSPIPSPSTSVESTPIRFPTLSTTNMTSSSQPLGPIQAARRPIPQSTMSSSGLPQDLQAKMKAFQLGRQGVAPPISARPTPPSPKPGLGGVPQNFRIPQSAQRPQPQHMANSSPAAPNPSLAQKRGLALGALSGPPTATAPPLAPARKRPGLSLSQMNQSQPNGSDDKANNSNDPGSLLDKYSDYIDKNTGSLRFKGKAILTNKGVEFSSGATFNISLDEVDTLDELGKGNYGTVYKVRHSRPRIRRPGQGLAGNKVQGPSLESFEDDKSAATGVIMAMKEIRLELDDAKFAAIIMELDILHRCISPFIVDFYGAFFQEGAVYICMEFMDGGSIDKLYGDGIPEAVLRKITLSTTMGLKSLKDEHNIIHRDVKPTNILINTKGQVKICDFGVSGNLVASIAKTNIGCQSYMAPERISSGGVAQAGANPGGGTYSVQSDIWSLGLSIIECALGQYPYPPETYDNIFSQLSAIVDGEPPDLPVDKFSPAAREFVKGCLMKIPKLRPTYAMLLQHAWLAPMLKPPTITEEDEDDLAADVSVPDAATADKEVADWVHAAIERRRNGTMGKKTKPALHTAPLDTTVGSPAVEQG